MYSKNLVYFDKAEKEHALSNACIDEGIKELCDTINANPYFMTMNSCEGDIFGGKSHCPRTYVDFYVLEDKYPIAEDLMILLSSKLVDELKAQEVELSVRFEQDNIYRYNEDNEVEDQYTNLVRKRYSIRFFDTSYVEFLDEYALEGHRYIVRERIKSATRLIKEYNEMIIKLIG